MARKRFGQNFLINQAVIIRIITAIDPQPHKHIVEIGPGLGALTKHLVASNARIDAIEIDRDLIQGLESLAGKNFTIHNNDVLLFDFATLGKDLHVVGNLPYNISTPLLFKLFENISIFKDMHFMLQKEVAQRLVAKPNGKEYGRLSVMAQYYCAMEILFDVPPESFDPAPKVNSSIVRFIPRHCVDVSDLTLLQRVVTLAFNHRRKTITNSLKALLTAEDLLQLEIDPQLRAENLTLHDYAKLTNYLTGK